MFAWVSIASLLGLGLAADHFADEHKDSEEEEGPVRVDMGPDALHYDGSDLSDRVHGNAQDNRLFGAGNDDNLFGYDGEDTLLGGEGDDQIFAGDDDDDANGGAGDDRIFLKDGDDRSLPGADDTADAGDDFIRGGAGQDVIIDSQGSNELFGDLGRDVLIAVDAADEDTPDTLHGGYGADLLVGDNGDEMTGGKGADSFVVAASAEDNGLPAMLLDFDLREDLFSIVLLEETEEPPVVAFAHDAQADQIVATVNGEKVAVLHDIEAADVPFIQTFVTTLPELMATA